MTFKNDMSAPCNRVRSVFENCVLIKHFSLEHRTINIVSFVKRSDVTIPDKISMYILSKIYSQNHL